MSMVNLDKWKTHEDEPRLVAECCICNHDIYRGEEYYSNGDDAMCADCYEGFRLFDD